MALGPLTGDGDQKWQTYPLEPILRAGPFVMSRIAKRSALPAPPSDKPAQGQDTLPDAAPHEGIPSHVWALLQEAGEEAAARLVELMQPVRFNKLPATVQRALLDLALTRAYGLPVRRSVAVNLSTSDADAVAASLVELRDSLPERRAQPRDVTPLGDEVPDE